MKANELRIGNYVLYASLWQQVYSIGQTAINIAQEPLKLNMVSQIPLTEDILLKCGFEKLAIVYLCDYLKLIWEGDAYFYHTSMIKVEVKFVHQLQNLYFALTGTELEIKL